MNNRVLFLISKGVSYVGTKLFSFALSWYILKQTGSGLGFSISLLVNYIPSIVFSMIAGRLLVARYSNTYHLLMLQYQGDMFSMYQDMENCCVALENETYALLNGSLTNRFMTDKIAEILEKDYFERCWKGSFIYEMFEFEKDYLAWLKHPNNRFTKKYHYDLYEYITNRKDANPPICETLASMMSSMVKMIFTLFSLSCQPFFAERLMRSSSRP